MSYKIGIAASAIFCFSAILILTGWFAYVSAYECEHATEQLTNKLHALPQFKKLLKQAGEIVSFGYYDGYSREIRELNKIASAIKNYRRHTILSAIAFFIIAAVFISLTCIFDSDKKFFITVMWIVSSLALVVGLFAPIMMIVTYKDIPIIGRVVFHFQSKGIISTIKTLFISGNVMVALPLTLFSVIIPFLKTVVTGTALLGQKYTASRSMEIIRFIGKWSMADVFVVALLLTYFTLNKDKSTNAEIQIGFYFFLGYVIFSMIVSHTLFHLKTVKTESSPFDDDVWKEPKKECDPFAGDDRFDDDPFK